MGDGVAGHVDRPYSGATDCAYTAVQNCDDGFSKDLASRRPAQQESRGETWGNCVEDCLGACPNAPGLWVDSFDCALLLFPPKFHLSSAEGRFRDRASS